VITEGKQDYVDTGQSEKRKTRHSWKEKKQINKQSLGLN